MTRTPARSGAGAHGSQELFAHTEPVVKTHGRRAGLRTGPMDTTTTGSLTPSRAVGSFSPPMRRAATIFLLLIAAGLWLPGAARAQGDEAPPPAAGVLRVLVPPVWWRWDQRFGQGTAGRANGQLEPIGVDFGADSLGTRQLPFLGPAEAVLRAVSGLPAFTMNLGRSDLQLNANVRTMPIAIAVGISRRLSIGALVPLVRSRVEALFRMDTSAATLGNVGANPAYYQQGVYDGFRQQVDTALGALRAQAAGGPAALRAQAQAALNQYAGLLCGLYGVAAGAPASGASVCTGAATATGSPFLPLQASAPGDSIATRLAAAQAAYAQLAALYAGSGISLPAFNAAFPLPATPLSREEFQRFLTDSAQGVSGDTLAMALHTRLGDVELGATYAFAERAAWRGVVTATVRLPTGMVDSDRDFIDVGTGQHQLGLELGTRNDVALGTGFRVVAAARAGARVPDQLWRRVSPPWLPIAPLSSRALLRRATGSYLAADLTPTWRIDDAFSLGVRYAFFRQATTRFTYVDAADSARVGLPASVLDQETAVRWMRIGAAVTFSTLGRFAAGRASLPYSLTVGYQNTFWGRGGQTPQASLVYVTLATYFRLFGNGASRAAW